MALLKFKRSAVPAKVPSIADLDLGELAINTYDGKVYTKKDDGTQSIVQVGGGGGVQTIASADGSVTVTGTTDINLSVATAGATNTVLLPVRNNSGATLAKGTAVYINGALGQNPTVTKAIATSDATSAQTLGLVTANIANNAVGNVTLIGTLTNVDTSAYSDGQQLYLSPTTAGALTATKPYAPNHLVYMAVVEHAHPSQGKLFVKVQNGYEMDELHDVSAQSPSNNDGLFYNTSTSLWEKKSIPTALGYTPYNATNPSGYITSSALTPYALLSGAAFTGMVTLTGAENSQLRWTISGKDWRANASPNGNWYMYDATNNKFPFIIQGNTPNDTLILTSGGNVTAAVDVRAPIFYDSNNTAYYIDPASSGISGMINGEVRFGGGGNSSVITSDGDFYSRRKSSTGTGVYYFADGGAKYLFWDGGRYLFGNAGPTDADVSFRAPIFYDVNNTGYYIDGNSTSSLYRLASYTAAQYNSGDWNAAFQNTPPQSYGWHGDISSGGPSGTWWFYESMRHSNSSNFWGTQVAWGWEDNANRLLQRNVGGGSFGSWVEYLNTSGRTYNGNLTMTGSIISSASDVRAPIFYDQNDTSTFINPNGESWIKGDLKFSRVAAGGDNDCFGGLELREVSLVGASQSAASYAPRVNFHWGARAAATIYMDAGGSFVFGGQGNITNNRRTIFCNELYATGNVTAYYSDDRLKTRIGNIENALDIVSSLNGFRYVDNDLAKTFGYANENGQIGVSAQEVQKHLPEIVRPAAFDVDHDDPHHGSKSGENYLTVDYSRLVPLLIEAIKELRDEVEALKNRG